MWVCLFFHKISEVRSWFWLFRSGFGPFLGLVFGNLELDLADFGGSGFFLGGGHFKLGVVHFEGTGSGFWKFRAGFGLFWGILIWFMALLRGPSARGILGSAGLVFCIFSGCRVWILVILILKRKGLGFGDFFVWVWVI